MSTLNVSADRDSHLSPPPIAQSWAPPRNPLPPHRLARLANALGVSTPMPAIHTPSPLLSPSYNGSSTGLDQYRRSPTPSTSSTFGFSPSTSKFLLHVIPPIHLPHDTDSFDSELTPPPSTASGYHTQFRRGTLVPVHPTLQSQLGAIAKEYALPSTSGMVLYLVSQPSARSPGPTEKSFGDDELDEPGPRLSEDIWRHLWMRVVKTELRDEGVSLAPPLLGLGISMAGRSTPYLNRAPSATSHPLPLLSTNGLQALQPSLNYPFTPSPTSPSTSDLQRFNTKSAPPSSSSRSPSEAETPDTSQAASSRADSLDLPGLSSSALIPILAKVEFDIDRRKAAWYEPWLRSRRMNHKKRAGSVNGRQGSFTTDGSADEGEERRARAPLPLRLNGHERKKNGSPASLFSSVSGDKRYLPLSESPHSMGSDSDDEDGAAGKDPLADVFGSDADTWADMRTRGDRRPVSPHTVQLALNAAELAEAPLDDEDEAREPVDDEKDVVELMAVHPQFGVDIPPVEVPGMQRSASRRRAPPPTPLVLRGVASTSTTPPLDEEEEEESPQDDHDGRTTLPYLNEEDSYDSGYVETAARAKSMYDPVKRVGGVYDDMDLGFEADDLDADDPHDRRKSQLIMSAQLDEIEKNLVQFSPRKLKTDLEAEQALSLAAVSAAPHLSPPGSAQFRAISNADVFPPTPRLPHHPDIHPEPEEDESGSGDDLSQQAAWPAVPFTSLPERASPSIGSPPRLAVNGVSASMPKRFRSNSRASTASTETEARKRDLAEQQAAYPAYTPSIGKATNSPLIPLSPDPFGRHPSQPQNDTSRQSVAYWDAPVVVPAPPPPEVQRKSSLSSISERGGRPASSRFSSDSMHGADAASLKQTNRTTLMSVKSIKKLWRKSHKASVSSVNTNAMRPISTVHENIHSPLSPPPRPQRPSMEDMDLPDVEVPMPPRTPTTDSFAPVPPRPSLEARAHAPTPPLQPQPHPHSQLGVPPSQSQLSVPPPPMLRSLNSAPIVMTRAKQSSRPSLDGLHFDQESPYPTRAASARAPSISSRPSSSASRPPSAASMNPSPATMPNGNGNGHNSARKSILKWKSATNGAGGGGANNVIPAPLTPSATTFRARKGSVSGSPSLGSPLNLPPDIPPSPKIPEQFMNSFVGSHPPPAPRPNSAAIARRRLSAKMASTSTDASSRHHRTQESMASRSSSHSHGSEETRDTHESSGFDTSNFEIISPKIGGTLSFPYHGLDQEQYPVDGVRM
ncbi:hypothetical protein B0H10DRAFT_2011281 [Mycena sp. CBHHK59/15]|nr:hypothetical protein B0H10DRAFT_2011281 [Mycena sp. CBHHK59/15]